MNQRPLKQCRSIGCTRLTREKLSYCEDHVHIAEEKKSTRNKYYDKNIRNKKHTDFYKSKAWVKARIDILTAYSGIDIYAYYVDKETLLANTVHHIIELKEDWDKRLDIENLFPTSDGNHTIIHNLYEKDKEGTQEMLRGLLERYSREFNIPPYF